MASCPLLYGNIIAWEVKYTFFPSHWSVDEHLVPFIARNCVCPLPFAHILWYDSNVSLDNINQHNS
jgi:hypothetical protein